MMDNRLRERRRLVSRERGRKRAGLIFLLCLAVVAVASFLWLRSSDVFAVREVTAPATRHVTLEQIADAVSDARGVSLLKVSTGAIERTLENLPYVRSVDVNRNFPNGLEVKIEEYEPVARVKTSGGKTWLVAEDGHVLERSTSRDGLLPLIVPSGQLAVDAGQTLPLNVLGALPVAVMLDQPEVGAGLPAIEQISVAAGGEVVVQLEGGTELRLGVPSDLKQKIKVATDIIQEYLRDGKGLEYVDASAADRVAVKPE